jgi:hypothetical protein
LYLTSFFSQMSISCTFLIVDLFGNLICMLLLIFCKCAWIIFNRIIFFSVGWFTVFKLVITWLISNIVQWNILLAIFTTGST